jgi:hypothetical protein
MTTTTRRFSHALLFVAVALVAASCGDPAPTTPTSIPEATLTTETFGGNLTAGGGFYHLVTARVGQVTMKMTGISDPSIPLGMEIGVYSVLSCTSVMQNPKATIGSSLVGVATSLNTLCLYVFDPGTIPADTTVTYSIDVTHY